MSRMSKHTATNRESKLPDSIGEEEVWRMHGAELRQEGGRDRDSDVTCGGHTLFVMDIPKKRTLFRQVKESVRGRC